MDLVKRSLSKWINGAIVLTLGILIIIMGASSNKASTDSANAISVILGIICIIIGSLGLVLAIISGILTKRGFAAAGASAGVTLALGISLCVAKYAAGLIGLLVYIIPFVLIILGALILGDGVYQLLVTIKAKKNIASPIVSILVGLTALVLGCLCVGNNPVIPQSAQLVTFGIIVVAYACVIILSSFFVLPTIIVVEQKEE